MFITIPRDEAHARLHAAGWSLSAVLFETAEVWRHADGREVTLTPEFDRTGCYEEVMIRMVEES